MFDVNRLRLVVRFQKRWHMAVIGIAIIVAARATVTTGAVATGAATATAIITIPTVTARATVPAGAAIFAWFTRGAGIFQL
ncbi:MAG: hypothetical protein ACKOUM_02220, partial [Sphingopyxis sp.]